MDEVIADGIIVGWIQGHDIQVLNVAGFRANKVPGIHDIVVGILELVLKG